MDLHIYTDDYDTVVARSLPDAFAVMNEHYGDEPEECVKENWYQKPDDEDMAIYQGNDCVFNADEFKKKALTMTAAQWCAKEGRGYLCSSEC